LLLSFLQLVSQTLLRPLVLEQLSFQLTPGFSTVRSFDFSPQRFLSFLALGQFGLQFAATLKGVHGHFFNRFATFSFFR
jgi:hypothetical protein